MKAIIEFDLKDQDDLQSYNARNLRDCIWEFDQRLRSMYKYEGVKEAQLYRQMLYIYLNNYNIKL